MTLMSLGVVFAIVAVRRHDQAMPESCQRLWAVSIHLSSGSRVASDDFRAGLVTIQCTSLESDPKPARHRAESSP
jgi:hypothetical protein